MSQSKNRYEAERWLTTAEEDLRAAHSLHDSKNFSHACFMAQQSAEKAIKALWLKDLTPGQSYTVGDAGQAIEKAIFFLTETRKLIKGL